MNTKHFLRILPVLFLLISIINAMPPRPGLELPPTDYEEMQQLGINVAKRPIRDIGKRGIYNTPGDVVPLVSGTKQIPVVCIKYQDYTNTYLVANFQAMLFSDTWTSGSAKKYYNEVSYSVFTIQGTVVGWYTSDSNKVAYRRGGGTGNFVRAAKLVKEAAMKADPYIDYSLFDDDGDGYVDAFTCIRAGFGYEETLDTMDIHSHAWSFSSAGIGAYVTGDGVIIDDYTTDPERSSYSNKGTMVCIGVFCHEWGHALSLPDLYDTDGGGAGLGDWCLMAGGSWGANGNSPWYPAHMNVWAKMELGWINPTAVRRRNLYSIPQVETNSKAYWLISRQRTFKEYFLVENRRKTKFDTLMYGQGLLIYHIDDSVISARRGNNRVNAGGSGWKYGVALEQADGLDELYSGADNGDAGDPFPGSTINNRFDSTATTPNSRTNYPSASPLVTSSFVKNIPASSSTMSCTLSSGVVGQFTGGPDASSYRWIDSDTTGGPTYSWIDISGTGTPLGTGDDARYWFKLPFNFKFYGTNYDTVWVCTNGWLSFGSNPGISTWVNASVPWTDVPNRAVFVFWDDLDVVASDNANMYYQVLGSAPNRYCVITWKDVQRRSSAYPFNQLTFQAILYENNNNIILQYKDCAVGDSAFNWGKSATVGIENSAGTVGLQYLYNGSPTGNLLASERAIRFFPTIKDAGVTAIEYPTGSIDSTSSQIIPRARVKNFGTDSTTFQVTFKIGSTYTSSRSKKLNAGVEDTVNFTAWTPIPGNYTTRCSTYLLNDVLTSNDTLGSSVTITVKNVGVIAIENPTGTIDSTNTPVIPRARVRNYGSSSETFNVTFKILGTSYNQSRSKLLLAGAEDTVNFITWTPMRGTYTTRCSVYLASDVVRSNDTLSNSVTVQVKDVGVTAIEYPIGIIDSSSATIIPRAKVRNNGTNSATFNVTFKIGSIYTNTRSKIISAGNEDTVNFNSWIPVRGTHSTRCSTYLVGDVVKTNDTLSNSVTVQVKDVGVTQIVTPFGLVDSSGPITPQVRVKNYGTNDTTFNVTFKIGSIYTDTRSKTLSAGTEDTVNFLAWQPIRGTYATRCSVYLLNDVVPANDTLFGSATIIVHDIGVTEIVQPVDSIDSLATIVPKAKVKNFGTDTETFNVKFTISGPAKTTWFDDSTITLASGDSITIDFASWTVGPRGNYTTKCSTGLVTDIVPTNDKQNDAFTVIGHEVGAGWVQKESLPTQIINKYVKDGGALVAVGSNLYAFRGWKSNEFYMFNGDTWEAKDTIQYGYKYPVTVPPKINKKTPGKGASLCYDGDNTIYATKGNGTKEFWAYDISLNIWTAKAYVDVPKGLKGGTSMLAKEGEIYLLAGGQKKDAATNFFVYNPTADTALGLPWTGLTTAPLTPPTTGKLKVWKDGSAISIIGDTIYALKGGDKFNFFYAYDIAEGTWTEMESIPRVHPILGKKNKVGDGGAMTTDGTILYVIKGKGKKDFWSYSPISKGVWTPLDTVPGFLHKKSVPKTGAALAYANNYIWLLKGNKTPEFWRFVPTPGPVATATPRTYIPITIDRTTTHNFSFDVTPNPFTKLTTIRYTVPVSGKVSVKLYNGTGRLIETLIDEHQNTGLYTLNIENWKLKIPNGVYFLKYESDMNKSEIKLIVQ